MAKGSSPLIKKGSKRLWYILKRKIKLSQFTDAVIYIENPKVSIKQLVELISEFIEV